MTQQEWERVKETFDAALAEAPPGRAAFLQSNCGEDSALRREVERLLAEHERASGFLEPPSSGGDRFALSGSQSSGPEAPLIGQKISHYEIVAAREWQATLSALGGDTRDLADLNALSFRYGELTPIGAGGMGIVLRARDLETGELVALKILKQRITAERPEMERFKEELRLARKVHIKMFVAFMSSIALAACRASQWNMCRARVSGAV